MVNYKLTFLGTGTSQGIPVIGCGCEVCKSHDFRDNRLRSSVMVQSQHTTIIIDTGPDFRQQCLRNKINKIDAVLYTHEHMDHVSGLDDIRPFNYIHQKGINLYAEERVLNCLKRIYKYAFDEEKYPGVPEIKLHPIDDKGIIKINDLEIKPIRVYHKNLPVLGFIIGDLCYITDANEIPAESMHELKNCKILIINALRHQKHVSHFTFTEAIEIIQKIKPEKGYLTHISHQLGKHEQIITSCPCGIEPSYDGLEIIF
jgi:phosphoribosyl 1,2-cyclic phosphate phosphodiesterase